MEARIVRCPTCGSTQCHPLFEGDWIDCLDCDEIFHPDGPFWQRILLWLARRFA